LQTLTGFLPAALVVAAAAFGTNYLAHGDWRTPYAHRRDGPIIATLPDHLHVHLNAGAFPAELFQILKDKNVEISDRAVVVQRSSGDRWFIWDDATRKELVLQRTPEGAPKA